MTIGLSWRRLKALVVKEFVQIVRDPSSISIAFVMPVVLLLLNGYGLSLDARAVPFGVVIEAETPRTLALWRAFADTDSLRPTAYRTVADAEHALLDERIRGFVVVRADTVRRLALPGESQPFQVVVDGVDANTARLVEGYAQGVLALWAGQNGYLPDAGVTIEHRFWFNPGLRSADFIVPGMVAIVMTLVGALLTALVVAREWERGTMESLMAAPVATAEIVLAKLVSNYVLGIGAMALSTLLGIFLFGVPFRGSPLVLFLIGSAFLLTALSLGLLISTVARNQFVAAQITFIATYMPALMLSGLIFDINSMPRPLQDLTVLVPARYFVSALQTEFLVGDVARVLLPDAAALMGFAVAFAILVLRRTRRTLEP